MVLKSYDDDDDDDHNDSNRERLVWKYHDFHTWETIQNHNRLENIIPNTTTHPSTTHTISNPTSPTNITTATS